MEFPRVVATLAAFVGDIGLAEDLAQDALVDALRQWPRDGTPQNPGAWLTTVAKRKAVDRFRRNHTLRRSTPSWAKSSSGRSRCPARARRSTSIRHRRRRSPTTAFA